MNENDEDSEEDNDKRYDKDDDKYTGGVHFIGVGLRHIDRVVALEFLSFYLFNMLLAEKKGRHRFCFLTEEAMFSWKKNFKILVSEHSE